MELLSIGEMAKLNNVSVQTLRYYDRLNLLKPAYIDEETNYRYYDIKQSAILDTIQYMKLLGMSLSEISEQLEKEDIGEIHSVLKERSQYIDREIEMLNYTKNSIEACIDNFESYLKVTEEGQVEIEYIPDRKAFCYDGGINIYDHGLETYEYILRELKKQIIIKNLPMVYFCNVGSILRKEMIDSGKFVSSEIFVFVDDDFRTGDGIEIIEGNYYACIYFHSFWKEKEYARKLFRHIEEEDYEIIGDYICEVVTEFPIIDKTERNMFIKLQVPIKSC